MIICVLFPLCFVTYVTGVVAEPDNEVKRGVFPFMGFIFYQDVSIADETGERFRRGAVLIRPSWLISASLDRNEGLAFPHKTLLARFGTVNIDLRFNLNEDEEEQEREVIQVVQPYGFNSSQWWFYDINLMKTLVPFNITAVIAPITPYYKRDIIEKSCKILVFTRRFNNVSEDRILMQLSVELLSPTTDCGLNFKKNSMICAADSDDNKNFNYEPDYCQGNGGGPLLCEAEVIALQTYINDDCKQPHLFQHLAEWERFINCGIEERCDEEVCNTTCVTINKDTPTKEISFSTSEETTAVSTSQSYSHTITASTVVTGNAEETEKMTKESPSAPTLTLPMENHATVLMVSESNPASRSDDDRSTTWSTTGVKIKEKSKSVDHNDESDNMERKTKVQAQQQMVLTKARSSADKMHLSRGFYFVLMLVTMATQ